jgi:hypothetical protein
LFDENERICHVLGDCLLYHRRQRQSRGKTTVRLNGIRLLLVFVATNTIMILMLVPSMTSKHPWLAYLLPGQFQAGGNYSGYWVFFALVLLVDAITVVVVALSVLLPALRDVTLADLDALKQRLADQAGIGEEARARLLENAEKQLTAARYQMFVGRSILIVGAAFLVIAFASVTLSFTRAMPQDSMFVVQCVDENAACPPNRDVANASVKLRAVQKFTLDQIVRASLFGAPEVYDWHIGRLASNPHNGLFSHFVFAFRLLFGLILILTLVSLRFPAARAAEEAEPAGLPLAETRQISA